MKLFSRRRARTRGMLALPGLAIAATCLVAATPASADGPCGQDYTSSTACAVNSTTTPSYSGTLVANNDGDYYVFHAVAGTHLALTITDNENAGCSTANWPVACGQVSAELYDAQANNLGGPGSSQPQNNITVPQTWSYIIQTSGTYYVEVSGNQGQDANENPTNVPYTLTVGASPAVEWPPPASSPPAPVSPPPPPCVVPHYGGASLATVEHRIAVNHCAVGVVRYGYDRFVHRGRVMALSRQPGTHLASGIKINIWVSRGRRPRQR